jgi:hypothetical protein
MAKIDETPKKQSEKEYLTEHKDATPYDMLMAGVITQDRFAELDKSTKGAGTMTAKEYAESQKATQTQK